jgi:DNA-binding CsgD family transcriptional regulator
MALNLSFDHKQDLAEQKRKWNLLRAKHGPELEERVLAILSGPWGITRAEAKVAVLGELGYDCMDSAILLGLDDHTVKNRRAEIRRKTGMPRSECEFGSIFLRLLPVIQKNLE